MSIHLMMFLVCLGGKVCHIYELLERMTEREKDMKSTLKIQLQNTIKKNYRDVTCTLSCA